MEIEAGVRQTDAETDSIRQSNYDKKIHRKLRVNYAKSVFCYLIWYSLAVLAIILALLNFEWVTLGEAWRA
jgi:hypothetical protein